MNKPRKEKILSVMDKLNRHIVTFGRKHSSRRYCQLNATMARLREKWGKTRNQ